MKRTFFTTVKKLTSRWLLLFILMLFCGNSLQAQFISVQQGATLIPTNTGTHNFGSLNVGANSGMVTFTVDNQGAAALKLSDFQITGTDAAMFTTTSWAASSINAGSNTTFGLQFAPTSGGAKTATVSIGNNVFYSPTPSSFSNKSTADGLVNNSSLALFTEGTKLYLGTTGGLSISADGGNTFSNKTTADGLANNTVRGVYADGTNLYAATNGGLSISADGGNTFTNKTTADGLGHNICFGVYVAGTNVYAATFSGLSVSTDGGATFTNKTSADGLAGNRAYGVYAEGTNVYAGTDGGLSISADGGGTFTNKTTADGLGSNIVLTAYVEGTKVYAGTDTGLSISTDGGNTFTNKTTADGLGHNNITAVYAVGTAVYAATNGGLSFSTDGGNTFTNKTIANGLGSDNIRGVRLLGGNLYAATNGGLSVGNAQAYTFSVTGSGKGSLAFNTIGFTESTNNNGSVATFMTITLTDEIFTGANGDEFISIGGWNILGTAANLSGTVFSMVVFGGELYAGSNGQVQKWNGTSWQLVGNAGDMSNAVTKLHVFGGELYAGSENRVHKWSGTTWDLVGTATLNTYGYALETFGGELYVGTQYQVRKWSGTAWDLVGGASDLTDIITWLKVYNGELYVGSNGQVRKWSGTTWDLVGGASDFAVYAFSAAEYEGELYAGGTNKVKKWSGGNWVTVGSASAFAGSVASLKVFNGELYGGSQGQVYKWDGTSWGIVGTSSALNGMAFSLSVFNNKLYAGTQNQVYQFDKPKLEVSNLPPTLKASAIRLSNTQLGVRLTGNATSHSDSDDISNLNFSFGKDAFTGGNPTLINNFTTTGFLVNFSEPEITLTGPAGALASNGNYVFTTVTAAGNSGGQTFTFGNTGDMVLKFSTATDLVKINGPDANKFTSTQLSANAIANGATAATDITFTPGSAGFYTAFVTVENTDSDENPFIFTLYGAGSGSLAFHTLGFTESVVNDGSISTFITVTLTGDTFSGTDGDDFVAAKLTVSNLPAGLSAVGKRNGANRLDIQLSGNAAAHANANDAANLDFRFEDAAFTKGAAVLINNFTTVGFFINFGDAEINLKNPALANIAPGGSYDFGNVAQNASSGNRSLTVENLGIADLKLTGFQLNGPDAALFTTVSWTNSSLSPAGNTVFSAIFSPLSLGVKTAFVTIANNDPTKNPYTFTLTGTGVPPGEINVKEGADNRLTGSSLTFGKLYATLAVSKNLTVENIGIGLLTFGATRAEITGVNADEFVTSVLPATLANGTNTPFKVSFTPKSAGVKTAVLKIYSDDQDEPTYSINLSGEGLPVPPPPVNRPLPTFTDFDLENKGQKAIYGEVLKINIEGKKIGESIIFRAPFNHRFGLSGSGDAVTYGYPFFNLNTAGTHTIIVTLTDQRGRVATVEITFVNVGKKDSQFTENQLNIIADRPWNSPDFSPFTTAEFDYFITSGGASKNVDGSLKLSKFIGEIVLSVWKKETATELKSEPLAVKFNLTKATQSISFPSIGGNYDCASRDIVLEANATSGLPVNLSVSGPGKITGTALQITGAGQIIVKAEQAGDEFYLSAASLTKPLFVHKKAQKLTFNPLTDLVLETAQKNLSLSAFSDAGSGIVFEIVRGSDIAEISGTTLVIKGSGYVSVQAKHPGNECYKSAYASHTFVVRPKLTITSATLSGDKLTVKYEIKGALPKYGSGEFVCMISDAAGSFETGHLRWLGATFKSKREMTLTLKNFPVGQNYSVTMDWTGRPLAKSKPYKIPVWNGNGGRTESEISADLAVYPNPSSGVFRLQLNTEKIQSVEVRSVLGQEVLQQKPANSSARIDLNGQPAGIYLLQIRTESGKTFNRRLILK